MRKVRVPVYGTPNKSTQIDPEATKGATVGRDLYNADGTLYEPPAATEPSDEPAVTIWRRILEIPKNVKALAAAAGTGLFAVTGDSTGAFRTIRPTANETTIADGDGVAGDPTVGLADLEDSGAGTFKLLTRDAKGRVSGTADGDTDDVPEGAANLYFTDARADARIPPGYIDGLQLECVSGSAITVTSGAAYIESAGSILRAPSAIAKAGLSLSASSWYHVYLFDKAGTPDVEIVTTPPASPYNGTARSKTGDTSRRYLGSVRTGGAAVIQNFKQTLNDVLYVNAPLRALNLGTATVRTSVSASGGLPETAFMLKANASNSDAGLYVLWYHPSSGAALRATAPSADNSFELPLNAAQEFQYGYTGGTPTGGAYLDICGYSFER